MASRRAGRDQCALHRHRDVGIRTVQWRAARAEVIAQTRSGADLALVDVPQLVAAADARRPRVPASGEVLIPTDTPSASRRDCTRRSARHCARDPRSGAPRWVCATSASAPATGWPACRRCGSDRGINTMIRRRSWLAIPTSVVQRFVTAGGPRGGVDARRHRRVRRRAFARSSSRS